MKSRMLLVSAVVLSVVAVSFAQKYETGKIVSIHKHEAQATKGGTDAPLKSSTDDYDVVISVGDTNYTALYHHHGDLSPAWSEGKEVQVSVMGKALSVKTASGKAERLKILSRKSA
jgi:hypothetical protein